GSTVNLEKAEVFKDNGISVLYALNSDRQSRQYLESNLARILNEKHVPIQAKSQVFYIVATNLVQDILADPRSGQAIKRSKDTVQGLVKLILTQKDAFFHLVKITSHDYYTYTHSVNVCTLAVGLARRLGIVSPQDCTTIGMGALLHDVGKCMIDLKI